MADKRISDLTSITHTGVTNASMLPIVVASNSVVTNKIVLSELKTFLGGGTVTGSGVGGYLASWTTTTEIEESGVYNDANFVGIGTASRGTHTPKLIVYSTTQDNHYAAVGTSPSYRLYNSLNGYTHMGTFGLATAGGAYLPTSASGDVVISATANILFGTGNTERFKLSTNGSGYFANDSFINGVRLGKGGNAVATNTAIGVDALVSNQAAADLNTAIGYLALSGVLTTGQNTAIGANALKSSTGTRNTTGVGTSAFRNLETGDNNTAIGAQAGRYLLNGASGLSNATNSTYIGYDTRASAQNVDYEICIGTSAQGNGSYTTTIGASNNLANIFFGYLQANSGLTLNTTIASCIVPRLTTTQRDALNTVWKVKGAIIYNMTTNTYQGYNGTTWLTF